MLADQAIPGRINPLFAAHVLNNVAHGQSANGSGEGPCFLFLLYLRCGNEIRLIGFEFIPVEGYVADFMEHEVAENGANTGEEIVIEIFGAGKYLFESFLLFTEGERLFEQFQMGMLSPAW